jgi:hypothetical protein
MYFCPMGVVDPFNFPGNVRYTGQETIIRGTVKIKQIKEKKNEKFKLFCCFRTQICNT